MRYSLWTWHPSVIIGCAALLIGYLILVNFRLTRKFIPYMLGVLVLLLALESPLDALGDTYLFSAHMLQHQLLILASPPLLLIGVPEDRIRKALGRSGTQEWKHSRAGRTASYTVYWIVGVATIWVWHLPALYDAALANETIHLVEHLLFLVTSTIFWWPVLAPLEEQRLPLLGRAAYLLLAAVACDILGTLIAYSPPGLYSPYLHPQDVYGILPLLRDRWGITPSVDQQAGGLLMGITGDPVYILVALSAMARWYKERAEKRKGV